MKKGSFFSDFREFISRGNVVDMAVGVVIGASFGKIVTGLVNFIINPFVGLFMKNGSLDSLKTVIRPAVSAVVTESGEIITPAVTESAIMWGSWIQTILDFLIISLCVFTALRILVKVRKAVEQGINRAKQMEAEVNTETQSQEVK